MPVPATGQIGSNQAPEHMPALDKMLKKHLSRVKELLTWAADVLSVFAIAPAVASALPPVSPAEFARFVGWLHLPGPNASAAFSGETATSEMGMQGH